MAKKRGFTLIEVIIAVAILVIIAVPIANALLQSGDNNKKSRRTLEATQLAQKMMEDVKNRLQKGEDLAANAPGKTVLPTPAPLATPLPTLSPWANDEYPVVNRNTDDDISDTFNTLPLSEDVFKTTSSTKGEWEARTKDGSYLIKFCVEKKAGTAEGRVAAESTAAPVNLFTIDSSNPVVSGDDTYTIKKNTTTNKIEIKNLSDTVIATQTTGDYDDLTLEIGEGLPASTSTATIKINNSYRNLNNLNIILKKTDDKVVKFVLDADHSIYNISNINLDERNDSSHYDVSATTSGILYNIEIKVTRKDDKDWVNPLADIKSSRFVRR